MSNPPPTYLRSGPHLSFYPLWAWIEEGLGRPVNHLQQLRTLLPTRNPGHIYKWRREGVRLATAQRIATHFGVTPADIWGPDWAKGTHLA